MRKQLNKLSVFQLFPKDKRTDPLQAETKECRLGRRLVLKIFVRVLRHELLGPTLPHRYVVHGVPPDIRILFSAAWTSRLFLVAACSITTLRFNSQL